MRRLGHTQTLARLVLVAALVLIGCAAFQKVIHTIADLALDACQIFGEAHPAEFGELVKEKAPQLSSKVGFSVQEACAIAEVVKPFIDSQMELQRAQTQHFQLRMEMREALDAGVR